MITGIAHVCIAATDLAATERFYCDTLGFRKVFDFVRGTDVIGFYLEVSKRSYVEVFRHTDVDAKTKAPISHICFETDDIDATLSRLKTQGYTATDKKLGADQSWQFWTTDPSGVRLEFHQYTENSSQRTGKDCIVTW